MQRLSVFMLLAGLMFLHGCTVYGIYEDQRLVDTITDDKTLSAGIKSELLKENFIGGWSVAVYSYYGNVFLIGEASQTVQNKALAIARHHKPRSVTPHWFVPANSDVSDIVLATSLRKELLQTGGLSSTRIDTEVNAGRVVLLGVVGNDDEKRLAGRTAREVNGVTSVTNYLMLPSAQRRTTK